jgi:uridine kinase
MDRQEAFVIAISGPSGAGKSTLVAKVTALLGKATALYSDSYERNGKWHPDSRQWVEQGCDPNQWVSIPQLVEDVQALRQGRAITLPESRQVIEPAAYLVLEEPWGRERDELRPWIDFVVHVDIPLDIALCRKLLREAVDPSLARDPLAFLKDYLTYRLGEVYRRQQQAGAHADLVVDGLRSSDDLAREIVSVIRLHSQESSPSG